MFYKNILNTQCMRSPAGGEEASPLSLQGDFRRLLFLSFIRGGKAGSPGVLECGPFVFSSDWGRSRFDRSQSHRMGCAFGCV